MKIGSLPNVLFLCVRFFIDCEIHQKKFDIQHEIDFSVRSI